MLLNLNAVGALTEMKLNLFIGFFFVKISFRLCEVLAHFLYRLFQIHPNSILSTEISKDAF